MSRCIRLLLAFAILFPTVVRGGETPPGTEQSPTDSVVIAVKASAARPKATVSDAPVTVSQLQDLSKASKAQLEAVKKYAESRREAQEASRSLVAIANAIAAKGGLATEEDLKTIDEAKARLAATAKSIATLRDEARKAQVAAQAAAARATVGGATAQSVREDVDVEDPIERFLLLLPGGPLVVQVAMTVDGKPFRTAREALIDELLSSADTDKDGKATWQEALRSPVFTLGRIRVVNDQQIRQYLTMFDKNEDELVDRGEVRGFVASFFQGDAFTLSSTASRGGYSAGGVTVFNNGRVVTGGGAQADVQSLLDVNSDGVLSKEEIAGASDRLKSRDANDDDLLYATDITGSASGTQRRPTAGGVAQPAPQQSLAVMLGPTAKSADLFAALTQRYGNDKGLIVTESLAAVPGLFETLDVDKSGMIEQEETLTLNTMEPHVELAVALGDSDGEAGLKVGRLASSFQASAETKNSLAMTLPGVNLSFVVNAAVVRTFDYSQTATSYLTRFDGDKNGYLDEKELGANFARMAQMWDTDSDGKIFAKEIEASYRRMQAPLMSQVRATAANAGNPLFQTLDISGDGRLSLREMRTARERILTFDENKDGEISAAEIPVTISVTFAQGYGGYTYGRTGRNTGTVNSSGSAPRDQPAWFTRMDRNGDGDVTLKEFLGEKADFEKIDTNKDGFIEPAEAKAATADPAE